LNAEAVCLQGDAGCRAVRELSTRTTAAIIGKGLEDALVQKLTGNRGVFWFVWLAGLAVLGVMSGFAAATDYFPGDLRVAHWIQDLHRVGFGHVASFTNFAGDTWPASLITIAFAAVFALMERRWEGVLVVLTFVPSGLRQFLAWVVGRPRPSSDLLQVTHHASGHSFPSGHTAGAVVLFGILFLLAGRIPGNRSLRWLFRAFCVFMILATGPARVYVGAHWPSDVLGGYLFGLLSLALLDRLCRQLERAAAGSQRPRV
jgi:undecaprenyl-diphosphatase